MKVLVAFTYGEWYNMKKRGEADSEEAWTEARARPTAHRVGLGVARDGGKASERPGRFAA